MVLTGENITHSAQPERQPFSRVTVALLSLLWLVAASWLQLIRMTGSARPWNSLWAEDGGIFLTNAYQRGLTGNLFRPSGGYYQVICRLLAQPAGHLPVSWGAAWIAWSAAVVVALCSLIVWNRAQLVVRHLGARVALALLVPFLPQVIFEVTGAVNDVHWYLDYTLFWVLIVPPRSIRGCIATALFAVLVGLSDPLAGLMLLVAAVAWWVSGRDRRALAGPFGLVVAIVIQYIVHTTGSFTQVSVASLPAIYGVRVVLSSFLGDHLLLSAYPAFGLKAALVACVVMAVVVIALIRRAARPAVVTAVVCFLLSAVFLAVTFGERGTMLILNRTDFTLGSSRYTVVPLWLLFTGLIVLADGWVWPRGTVAVGLVRVPIALLLVGTWLLAETVSDWSLGGTRLGSPAWSTQVRAATASCRGPTATRDRVAPQVVEGTFTADDVALPVAPLPAPGNPPLFAVVVPCRRLLG